MRKKTIFLQLFAEDTEVEEVVEQPTETTEVEEPSEPVSYRDLEYKYKDEKGKLSDYSPEDVVTNFQLGKKYKEHEEDIALTGRLKTMYGVKTVKELNDLFDKAIDSNIRDSAPEGIPEDKLDDWVAFQKQQQEERAKAPERQREATMLSHIESLKEKGRIKSANDIPDEVLEIYKARDYKDLEGAFDARFCRFCIS